MAYTKESKHFTFKTSFLRNFCEFFIKRELYVMVKQMDSEPDGYVLVAIHSPKLERLVIFEELMEKEQGYLEGMKEAKLVS